MKAAGPVEGTVTPRQITRRQLVRGAVGLAAGLAAVSLAACGAAATPAVATTSSAAATTGNVSTAAVVTTASMASPVAAQTSAAAGKAAQMRFEMYSSADDLTKWKGLAADLLKQDPTLDVSVTLVTGDAYAKYQVEIAGGTPPDIMEFESKRMPSFAVQTTLYDLTPLASRSTTVKPTDFYQVDWLRSQWHNKLFIYPYESKPAVIFYNKTLFDNKSVPYPNYSWADPKWTWDEFLSVAQKLSGGTGATQTFGYYHPTWWVYAQPYIWSNGGHILDTGRTKSVLDQPPAQVGLQFLQDLIYKYRVAASPVDAKPGVDKLFYAGRLGMWFTNNGQATALANVKGLQWDVAPLPLPPGKTEAITRAPADGYAVAAATKQIDAVWKAVDFLGSPESAKQAEGVPSRKAVSDAGDYALAKQPGIKWKNYSDAFANARDEPVTTEFQDMDSAWGKVFDPYWNNKATPKELAATIAPITESLLQKAVRT
jgi:multiple sugar transport system substrate-binding protein